MLNLKLFYFTELRFHLQEIVNDLLLPLRKYQNSFFGEEEKLRIKISGHSGVMSGNYFPTGQTPYPVNSQFGFASYSSSTHTTAVEMPWNMNLNYINNQAAGYWHYNQVQPSQPPLPLYPPPQQPPPPPSLPPQENHWLNDYSNHQQINPTPGSGTYQTENVVPYPYPCYPQYPFQSPTSFPAYSSVSQVKLSFIYPIPRKIYVLPRAIFINIKSIDFQVIQSEFHVAGIHNTGSRNVNEKKGNKNYSF